MLFWKYSSSCTISCNMHTHGLTAVFWMNLGFQLPPWFPSFICSKLEPFYKAFFYRLLAFHNPTSSLKALMGNTTASITQSNTYTDYRVEGSQRVQTSAMTEKIPHTVKINLMLDGSFLLIITQNINTHTNVGHYVMLYYSKHNLVSYYALHTMGNVSIWWCIWKWF